jgi:hypothetical protein
MGYAVGLIGLAAPMAAVAAVIRYTGRAERRRREALFSKPEAPSPAVPATLQSADTFDAWQAGFSGQSDPPLNAPDPDMQKAADAPRPSQS